MSTAVFLGGLAALLGTVVGSFLNVLIYRLPRMLEAQWAQWGSPSDATTSLSATTTPFAPFNLAVPASHCPHCGHALRWVDNFPVLSYLRLRGCCRHCSAAIGWRYPAIELLTGALFYWSFQRHGLSPAFAAWAGFTAGLVALAAIDADTTLLPDAITQPLLWSGLIAAGLGITSIGLSTALWGAVWGYVFLASVFWLFKAITGQEGMGQGDFKLLAALGAWLGWQALLPMVLIASVTGAAWGIWLRLSHRLPEDGYIPFGPFLALAGLLVMAWGPWPDGYL